MKISKLELERFIKAYQEYKTDNEEKHNWLVTSEYLGINGLYKILQILEDLFDYEATFAQVVQVLEVLGVEVV